jgi:transcription initiation factor TFIIB
VIEDNSFETNPFISDTRKNHANVPYLATAGSLGVEGKIFKKSWMYTTREKNLLHAKKKIDLVASRLKLPKIVITEANMLYKSSIEKNLNIGRDSLSILYACIYASCNIYGVPKTPLEIIAYSNITKNKMLKANKLIEQELKLDLASIDPIDLVPRFSSKLGLKSETTSLTIEIIQKIKDTKITAGRYPSTIVASAIYIASKLAKDFRTQREIANKIGVIEITIRKRSREIEKHLF